ncbi:MAG TPA: hypothetical protein VHE78_00785 [Gemmatimonadaceae bacterium]|nr:hypothetical protein [Gemmatimonadaceae bacterium]
MTEPHHTSDRGAAYTGLILGAIALAITVYSIVVLTNKHLEGAESPQAGVSAPR